MKTIVFGKSYTKIFYIFKKIKNFFYNLNIKGALIHTILQKNFIYSKILNTIKKNNFDNAIFVYGISDLLFYYPKKKYIDNIDVLEKIYSNIEKFVKFVSNFGPIHSINSLTILFIELIYTRLFSSFSMNGKGIHSGIRAG